LNLQALGWTPFFEQAFEPYQKEGYITGRVILEHKHMYRIYSEHGDLLAEVSGKLRYHAISRGDYPAVGDWFVLSARPDGSFHGYGFPGYWYPRRRFFRRAFPLAALPALSLLPYY
jgi:ribosome biogenesis GTPase